MNKTQSNIIDYYGEGKDTIISKKEESVSQSDSKLEKQVIQKVDQKLSRISEKETNIIFDIQEMTEAGWGFGC